MRSNADSGVPTEALRKQPYPLLPIYPIRPKPNKTCQDKPKGERQCEVTKAVTSPASRCQRSYTQRDETGEAAVKIANRHGNEECHVDERERNPIPLPRPKLLLMETKGHGDAKYGDWKVLVSESGQIERREKCGDGRHGKADVVPEFQPPGSKHCRVSGHFAVHPLLVQRRRSCGGRFGLSDEVNAFHWAGGFDTFGSVLVSASVKLAAVSTQPPPMAL